MSEPEQRRWSDTQLTEFRKDFDNHDALEVEWRKLVMDAIDQQTKRQEEVEQRLAAFIDQAEDLIEVWQDGKGVIRTGAAIGRFFKWLASFAIIGAIIGFFSGHWPK